MSVGKLYTYQDLLSVGNDEKARMDFVRDVVAAHKQSDAYREAVDAGKYYNGENPTIAAYEKVVYDATGKAQKNLWAANHKIASHFMKFAVRQKTSYLLGNGVSFTKAGTKDKLGESFDRILTRIAKAAKIEGVCFGFWNLNHIERFKFTAFAPMDDEEDGLLKAGVRFWRLAEGKPERYTLFEPDGLTDYIAREDGASDMRVMTPKRSYVTVRRQSAAEGVILEQGQNYPSFPIVPLKNGTRCLSELHGRRNTIDALDFLSSGMVNNVDEGSLIYWLIQNAGGMDEADDKDFLLKVLRTHVAHVEGDATVSAHQLEAPVEASRETLDMLNKKLYQDFSCFDASSISLGSQTATAIEAAYTLLTLDTDDFEGYVSEFVQGILALAGIDDKPSYTRAQLTNRTEEIQAVIAAASALSPEYVTRKILEIEGDADKADEVLAQMDAEAAARLANANAMEDDDGG